MFATSVTLTGQVITGDQPLVGVKIFVLRHGQDRQVLRGLTDQRGIYVAAGLLGADESYRVIAVSSLGAAEAEVVATGVPGATPTPADFVPTTRILVLSIPAQVPQ